MDETVKVMLKDSKSTETMMVEISKENEGEIDSDDLETLCDIYRDASESTSIEAFISALETLGFCVNVLEDEDDILVLDVDPDDD